jgi:hypothetical protein
MAYVKIEGIVEKPLGNNGFILVETVKARDFMMEKKWKVWNVQTLPDFGSFVEVTGEISTKIAKTQDGTDYITAQGNRMIDLNVNDSTVKVLRAAEVASPDVNSDWATAPAPSTEAPF